MEAGRALDLRGLCRDYAFALGFRRRTVLEGVDLALAHGRSLGLAGPNGSGKSTLLRILAGVDRPTAGVVRVLDGSPQDASVRRRVGYLPEESPFPPELSARSALDLLGSLHGMERRARRTESERLLELVGLRAESRRRLGGYSRGMMRRFGLAQAVLARPDLLLLDEPTAGLDAEGFLVLARILEETRGRGATAVLASHVVGDFERHCDELAVILDGRIAARGPPGEVLGGRTLLDLYEGRSAPGRDGAGS